VISATDAIKALLASYRNALVASDAKGCSELYTNDGVTMAQGFPTQVGKDAITQWYTACFEAITLDVVFDIKEVVVVSDEYAFARTTSAGTQKINKIGKMSEEANQELFVLQRVGEEWKIARYCFSSMNSPPQ
jgi:uncharacterized protein (TIGR02246 family)